VWRCKGRPTRKVVFDRGHLRILQAGGQKSKKMVIEDPRKGDKIRS
jgi:hypothetical protein